MSVFTAHARALTVLFEDVENAAATTHPVFVGTAGSILRRSNESGFPFYAHQFFGADGKRHERYVAGPIGAPPAEAAVAALRERITAANEVARSIRLLGREGFARIDGKALAVVAALHNHGVFAAGAVVVGSHAYGALLNKLGVRAPPYATEDVDVVRPSRLDFRAKPPPLSAILRTSALALVPAPSLHRRAPSTSFKLPGRAFLHVDLLAPSADEHIAAIAVPELDAHATTLPYLRYLVAESQTTAVLARDACCAARVPLPERFAVHKLLVSQLRVGRGAKSAKDVEQACVVAAALGDLHPGALTDAVAALPRSARARFRAALPLAEARLAREHPRAWEELHV